MSAENELNPGEKVLMRSRPTWSSFWVFFLGLALCGVGPFLQENPPISPTTGLIFATVFLLVILRRWSDVYTVTDQRVMIRGGLIARETYSIKAEDVSGVETAQGLNLRLVSKGHVVVRSAVPHQEHIIMYGQSDPEELKQNILRLAEEARGEPAGASSGGEGDGEG